MNKFKRKIILLQASLAKRLLREVKPIDKKMYSDTRCSDTAKAINETFIGKKAPKQIADMVLSFSNNKLAALIRSIIAANSCYKHWRLPYRSFYGNIFPIKQVLTSRYQPNKTYLYW